MASATVLDETFTDAGEAKLDGRNRVVLTKAVEVLQAMFGSDATAVQFSVHTNRAGQILLSPSVSIPAHEAWLYRNTKALQSVQRGIGQAGEGRTRPRGSFAKYGNDEIDD
jgi:hypothetical protein